MFCNKKKCVTTSTNATTLSVGPINTASILSAASIVNATLATYSCSSNPNPVFPYYMYAPKGINIKIGRKYIKVIQGGSVWGFIAAGDGSLKGIPHKKGDVFKAAGWRAPAKWARGSIFGKDKFYSWTGPNYLI